MHRRKLLSSALFSAVLAAWSPLLPAQELLPESFTEPDASFMLKEGLVKSMKNIIAEGEDLQLTGKGWEIREAPNVYQPSGCATRLKVLSGGNGEPGEASLKFKIPTARTCYIWVRTIDNIGGNKPFTAEIRHGGKVLAKQNFGGPSCRAFPTPEAKEEAKEKIGPGWVYGHRQYVWRLFMADLPGGESELVFTKGAEPKEGGDFQRTVDAVLITDKEKFEPHPGHICGLYVRLTVPKEQKTPIYLRSFGKRPYEAPMFTDFIGLGRFGAQHVSPIAAPAKQKGKKYHIDPGESSIWMNISPLLAFGGWSETPFTAVPLNKNIKTHSFRLDFATEPSDKAIFKTLEYKNVKGIRAIIDPGRMKVMADQEGSERSLSLARKAAEENPKGKRPEKLIFEVSMRTVPGYAAPESVERELETCVLLGLNSLNSSTFALDEEISKKYGIHGIDFGNTTVTGKVKSCICTPDREKIEESLRRTFGSIPLEKITEKSVRLNLADEPGFSLDAVRNCPECAEKYIAFLRENGVTADSLGLSSLEEARIASSDDTGAAGYWSRRYLTHTVKNLYRAVTETAQKLLGDIQVHSKVNMGTEVIFSGNLVQGAMNWFDLYSSGALTFGQTEDWNNLCMTRQTCGYMADVMYAACSIENIPFLMLTVLSHPWEFEAKAFTELGHGVKNLHFYRYGPFYADTTDSGAWWNPETFPSIRRATYAAGAVEDILADGKPEHGDAAMLHSVTSDCYHVPDGHSTTGKERIYLSLLLRHCGFRTDVLSEEMLETRLASYKMLFAADTHLTAKYRDIILNWVREGGTLCLTSGALAFDESNRKLGLDEAVGLRRSDAQVKNKNGMLTIMLKNVPALRTFPTPGGDLHSYFIEQEISGGDELLPGSRDHAVSVPCGKGRIIALAFLPGLDYMHGTKKIDGQKAESALSYDAEAPRRFIRDMMKLVGIEPVIVSDVPAVEANLIRGPGDSDAVVLANWAFERRKVTIRLKNAAEYKSAEGVHNPVVFDPAEGTLTLETGAGDMIRMKRK